MTLLLHTCSSDETQIVKMFEVVLSTIESKLQRVENLDRAVHHLMRKMDMMERKLTNQNVDILAAVLALEKQTNEAHVSVKLNQLSVKLDHLCGNQDDNDILLAQPSNRKSRVQLEDDQAQMEDVKDVINGMDRRLGLHINIVSENLGKMTNALEEVRNVLLLITRGCLHGGLSRLSLPFSQPGRTSRRHAERVGVQ